MKYTVFVKLINGNYQSLNINNLDKAMMTLRDLTKTSTYKIATIKDNYNNSIILSLKEVW